MTVTVRRFAGGSFLTPEVGIAATSFVTRDGTTVFDLREMRLYEPGSEIVEEDGTAWIVERSHMVEAGVRCSVKKKG